MYLGIGGRDDDDDAPPQHPRLVTRIEERQQAPLWIRLTVVLAGATAAWWLILYAPGALFGPPYEDRIGHTIRAVSGAVLGVGLVVLARRFLDRRPLAGLGLTSLRTGWRWLLVGMAFWLVLAGVGAAVALGAGWAGITSTGLTQQLVLLAVYLPVLVFLYEALPEELIFRGYVFQNLAERFPRWVAIGGQAVAFTVWGVATGSVQNGDRVLLFVTFALTLGLLRALTGNLWATIGFHVLFQYVTQFLSAADRAGAIRISGRDDFEVMAFWLLPIVIGGVVIVVGLMLGMRRRRQPG